MKSIAIAMLAAVMAPPQIACLKTSSMALSAPISVDAEKGIIRNAAVASVGEASGHGWALDLKSLEMLRDLFNAEENGVKMHFKHPAVEGEQLEDQLGAILGRGKTFRIDGDALRADVYLGEQAKKMPGLGDVWSYLTTIAKDDPTACGLSAVFAYDLEDSGGKMKVARPTKVYQVDFVGEPAANDTGLLAAGTKVAKLAATTAEIRAMFAGLSADCVAVIAAARACVDATTAMAASEASIAATIAAAGAVGAAGQALTVKMRSCIDICNGSAGGSMAIDDETSDAATICIRTMTQASDELGDAQDSISYMRWGTSDLARACSAVYPVLDTCVSTLYQTQTAARPMTMPVVMMSRRRRIQADRTAMLVSRVQPAKISLKK